MSVVNPVRSSRPLAWWQGLTGYQWTVFVLAALGWLFDTMDQQIFAMSRSMAMRDLVPDGDFHLQNTYGGYATTCFILGWATGGLIFGVVGDVWGRAKTMALTIFLYALFTGLSALSRSWVDFSVYRFLAGLGVGGEFAVGVALVAEVMPDRSRAYALGWLQALSAVGNITAALLIGFKDVLGGWRNLYWVGAVPALLACVVIFRLREPQPWLDWRARVQRDRGRVRSRGRLAELLGTPRWRRNAGVGLGLAVAGVFGLWGVAFWSPELIDSTMPTLSAPTRSALTRIVTAPSPEEQATRAAGLAAGDRRAFLNLYKHTLTSGEKFDPLATRLPLLTEKQRERMAALLARALDPQEEPKVKRTAFVLQQIGGFLGIQFLSLVAARFGRRPALALSMLAGLGGAAYVFYSFAERWQIPYLWFLLGFTTFMPFGGFAIYFPELFPTSLRSTGISFCYNVGRYITAFGPVLLPMLALQLHGRYALSGFRLAALILCSAYVIGLVALLWAPETRGAPLPEEETPP